MNKNILRKMGFGESVKKMDAGICPFCDKKVKESDLRDALSQQEHAISGLCQKCQDETFGGGE